MLTIVAVLSTSSAGRWAVAAAFAALAGCTSDDVGTPCSLALVTVACTASTDTVDYFESSAASTCDNLVCVHAAGTGCTSAGKVAGVCSKPCVADSDCGNGTVCRQLVLDPAFINGIAPGDPRYPYLGNIQSSNFCAAPSP